MLHTLNPKKKKTYQMLQIMHKYIYFVKMQLNEAQTFLHPSEIKKNTI